MEQKLEILLVEDDSAARKNIIDHIDDSDDFILIGYTSKSEKALELIEKYLPDAVILDLELHNGSGSGLYVLQGLKEPAINKIPYILVTTNNSSPITHEAVRLLGADFIMSKHQNDYSAKSVLDHLRLMRSAILSKSKASSLRYPTNETPEHYNRRITRHIMSELNYVGIKPNHKGYKYLTDAIFIMIKHPSQNIYALIAEKYGKSQSSIERAMQYSINRAWNTCCIDDLLEHYTAKINSDKGGPTTTEFVCYYANKIKNDY